MEFNKQNKFFRSKLYKNSQKFFILIKALTMSFYHHRNRIIFYLLFTYLNLSIKIHNQNIKMFLKILIVIKGVNSTVFAFNPFYK